MLFILFIIISKERKWVKLRNVLDYYISFKRDQNNLQNSFFSIKKKSSENHRNFILFFQILTLISK